jgi:hypothetical protein
MPLHTLIPEEKAELWIFDEALKVYLNGDVVYNYESTRTFSSTAILSETKRINLKKGINRLLVKSLQQNNSGYYDFSLNICEVESNQYYAGSRVEGLKFINNPDITDAGIREKIISSFDMLNCYPNPFNPATTIEYQVLFRTKVILTIFDLLGRKIKVLVNEEKNPDIQFIFYENLSGIYIYQLTFSEEFYKENDDK